MNKKVMLPNQVQQPECVRLMDHGKWKVAITLAAAPHVCNKRDFAARFFPF